MEQRRQRPNNSGQLMHLILVVLFLFLTISLIVKSCADNSTQNTETNNRPPVLATNPVNPTDPSDPDKPEGPAVVASATIGVTGDIMAHGPVLNTAIQDDGTYDFTESFRYIAPYFSSYDFMVANLEVTLGGTEAGQYRGYPTFNCPDSMIDALKNAGVDMVTTATNHSYDTGHNGFIRTQQVLDEKGMIYVGTRTSEDDAKYTIQNINGVKVGMINYTYEQEGSTGPQKNLNGIKMTEADSPLINSFNYRKMDAFYNEAEEAVTKMRSEGAEFVIFFMHWGNEYELTPSNTQKKIAQTLCEKGVDVIVGGHPHVVQPMQVLTSENGNQTICLYSTGNNLSNQRRHEIKSSPNGHTEDGIIFSVEFSKYSDGTKAISNVNVTPLWVSLDKTGDESMYTVLPVDITYTSVPAISRFADAVNSVIDPDRRPTAVEAFLPSDTSQIASSYNRTMNTVLFSLNECRTALGLTPVKNTPGN